ncbi:MAG: hypothetical protein CO030_04180 [Candidatus Magasanikbacteria bacterium CG_4_9_14_0_2_um_filter_42_11]|uniref:Uncharacterized protein n=1 Tax=Candidatus Magasanikbacteria bacterium CG_4_9_14_0_2_um_filter_42_11 TaxID=1974643 RepID=A0A2M8F8V0_9BACT|nr:MAG: hypothetical protein COU34_04985 [Candidatus Magasanikbacteria bacterium CG10_big_fil_rev_8_21_14_0_10_43_9]PIY92650.1 MAG: hypothetical protein COY70_02165 [Candidatus Magasanikbacteria bacterium CG_4_10_14_0_8_um_filter_42_12]PJC52175.1 MAG: hypothetical protein CO030_04180 [Candidatus Magasanikbacteria bacterium CG_4_9_14_0_2_um_filter_42_11]
MATVELVQIERASSQCAEELGWNRPSPPQASASDGKPRAHKDPETVKYAVFFYYKKQKASSPSRGGKEGALARNTLVAHADPL